MTSATFTRTDTDFLGSKDAHTALPANLSAGFRPLGGFSSGTLGASDRGSAVEPAAGIKPSGGTHQGKDDGKDGGSGFSHD